MKITKELYNKTFVENCFELEKLNGLYYSKYSMMLTIMTKKNVFQ